nr:MAG TPA: hypothetical protein [Microviridae sp.]
MFLFHMLSLLALALQFMHIAIGLESLHIKTII